MTTAGIPVRPVDVRSFGYLHGPAPDGVDLVIDLRRLLADPAHIPGGELLDLDGRDTAVRRFVFATPGALDLLDHVRGLAQAVAPIKPISVAFGCAGGRHRSVVLAEALTAQLTAEGLDATVSHLHVHIPRVIRPV